MMAQRGSVFTRWTRHLLLVLAFTGLTTTAYAAAPAGAFSDEITSETYDCLLSLKPNTAISEKSAVTVLLEWGVEKSFIQVTLSKQSVTVAAVRNGRRTTIGDAKSKVVPGEAYLLTVMRRGEWLAILRDGALIYRGQAPRFGGSQAGVTAGEGWTVDDARIQHVEPVAFADNFMRTADEKGEWEAISGQWALQSAWDNDPKGGSNRFNNITYAQNPFAWAGRGEKTPAMCLAGKPFWEDYTFTASVRPANDVTVGVGVNMIDAKNGLLVTWGPANDRGTRGNALCLYKLIDGRATLIGKDAGGFVPEQWYKLRVFSSINGVRVAVDGKDRITVNNVSPWRGRVALYVEGSNGAVFDDVTVYGRMLKTHLISENQLAQINQRFANDPNGMKEWSSTSSDWLRVPSAVNFFQHRCDFFGDHWMSLVVKPSTNPVGQLIMALNSDGKTPDSGYRAVLDRATNAQTITYTLYRDTKELAKKTGKLPTANVDYSLRLWHTGNKIRLEQDGVTVLEAVDKQPLPASRPTYRADGVFTNVRDVMVLGENALDYLFADAPSDWQCEGTWLPTTRWACAPQWSFLGGWSRGKVALWHKNRFQGDQYFEAFAGLKMEYPREREIYDNRYRDFGLTICGDGRNPLSGYTGIFGASSVDGKTLNQRSVLLRNGVEVKTTSAGTFTVPGRGAAHRDWFDLALRKHGAVIEFWVEGKLALTFTDPEPLQGGVPAIWSENNGISLARARITFANAPQLRTDPQVLIDEPWFPEWANVGKALTLDFPETWSTSGKPVQLQVVPHIRPTGEDASAVAIGNKKITFTPKVADYHWYEIFATDGQERSPSYHLDLPVFNPALNRDDSHAVILYRFIEGTGNVVKDRSAIKPAVDLTILKGGNTRWLPGQGLTVHGGDAKSPPPMMTAPSVSKLMSIATTKECAIELWVSTDTIYPPTGWIGCLFAWESPASRNFAVGHQSSTFVFAPRGATISAGDGAAYKSAGFRTGLQHLVITWDGKLTRFYLNGKKQPTELPIAWSTESWTPEAVLFLGNQADSSRSFLGTYYLMAIHDKCLNDELVLRHYNAGPSAH
ncbi:MAG: LamG-like jellyroll fold domain-containing protein [Armatimonadota bacterium]